jgi:hypothetical protein
MCDSLRVAASIGEKPKSIRWVLEDLLSAV